MSRRSGIDGLLDADARKQAIDPSGSYAVSAPAGSGKTELLIQRTLALLATVDQPESILGITFTRKAANEMRERVIKALNLAQSDQAVESAHEQTTRELAIAVLQRNHEFNWGLLENPSRLRFQTIDGLCRQLASQLCLETGIVVPPSMSEDSTNLYQKAAEKTLEFIDDKGAVGDSLRLLVSHLDGNLEKLVTLIADLLSSRDSWLPIIIPGDISQDYLQERVEALIEETLFEAGSVLALYSNHIEELLDYALRHKEGAKQLHPQTANFIPEPEASELTKWKALRSFLLTSAGTYRSRVTVANGFPTESEHASKAEAKARKAEFAELISVLEQDEAVVKQLNRLAILPEPLTNQFDDQIGIAPVNGAAFCRSDMDSGSNEINSEKINQAIFTLLPIAAASFNTLSQDLGETDFTAVAIAAIEALGQPDEPTPLALRLDYRIQHILVDEFQDTSRVQIDLLERLTAGWQADDGRSLFIVGDGMQSIYGFRKANVSLFIRARRDGIGDIVLTPLDLTSNFRSDQQIVDWVNQSFASLFPEKDNLVQGQVAFKYAEAINSSSPWRISLKGHANAELEAKAIASDIEEKISSGEKDLAILVRGRNHLQSILPALRKRKIQWQAQDIDPLSDRMAVMDIHSLTRALCVPADRIAWLSILRAPWAGLDMADLLYLCEWSSETIDADHDGFLPPWLAISSIQADQLSPEGTSIVNRLNEALTLAFTQLGKVPLREVIEWLWNTLGGHETLLETRDRQDVEDYLNLLEKQETGGVITDWHAFERRLSELYSQPENNNSGTDKNAAAKLQIMTIHKSKGLEFDHVYLPALGRSSATNTEPLLLWWQREYEDGSEGYLLAAKPSQRDKRPENKDRQSLYDYLRAEENERQRQETARLLYVACTRARKSLFLTGSLGWDENKEEVKKPSSNSMLAALWPLYGEVFSDGYQPFYDEREEQAAILDTLRRLPANRPVQFDERLSEQSEISQASEKHSNYAFSENYLARITGDLLHHSLMRIVHEHIDQPSDEHFMPDWRAGIRGLGLTTDQQKEIMQKLKQMLGSILSDKTGKWLLDASHEQSAAELEIDYLDAKGSVQLAIVDRTFVEKNTRWIIDYKSSSPKADESADDFLQREAATYKPQLLLYMSLFEEADKRALLYFPAMSASIEIQPI